jgi:hypothetical protein
MSIAHTVEWLVVSKQVLGLVANKSNTFRKQGTVHTIETRQILVFRQVCDNSLQFFFLISEFFFSCEICFSKQGAVLSMRVCHAKTLQRATVQSKSVWFRWLKFFFSINTYFRATLKAIVLIKTISITTVATCRPNLNS